MEEILNIEYHRQILVDKAIKKTKCLQEAAKVLGVSKRTVIRWKRSYGISKRYKKRSNGKKTSDG